MKTVWQCEKCEVKFDTHEECVRHEENCKTIESRWCYKCGETEEWGNDDDWAFCHAEGWHHISLGRLGYGSGLDGSDVNFDLCDKCLRNIINSFTYEGQEKIHNSGSNSYLPSDVWIRKAKGELTDEEYEEYGMYSPRQHKAYQEQYPVCNKVMIVKYNDGSCGSRCLYGAFGNKDGSAEGHQTSQHCYGCEHFQQREEGLDIPVVKNSEISRKISLDKLYEKFYNESDK